MKPLMILCTTALMASCAGGAKHDKTAAIDRNNFDTTVDLRDDFYRYATGGWQERHPLKPEYSRYGAFDMLQENNQKRIKELFASLAEGEHEPGSVARKIGDLYKMGLDSARLNAEGATTIAHDMEAIRLTRGREALSRLLGRLHAEVGTPFFTPLVDADPMNSSVNILNLYQSGLGMGDRDYYLEKGSAAIRNAYAAYLEHLFSLAGYSAEEAARAAASTLEIEDALAAASFSRVELRDPYKNYNKLRLCDLAQRYPSVDWPLYFAELGLEGMRDTTWVVLNRLEYMEVVDRLLGSVETEKVTDYLAAHYATEAAPYLSDDFARAHFEFYGKTLSGRQEQQPRWKRALAVPNEVLSEAVGEMYVQRYFPPENKERMLAMVGNLQRALGQHIDRLEWMSEQTKAKAHEKLAAFHVKIGYPDKWKDYSTLEIDPSRPYWVNLMRANRWETADQMADAGKSVDRDKWFMSPQTVNAYYNPTTNEICFPAAILQPPFFNADADDAVNYGAIGVVIGHEMTHGFDDQGRQYDAQGNLNNWWNEADAAAFTARADKLVGQFDAIEVLDGLQANGRLTLGENIADQGGLRVAYTALQNALQGTQPEPIDNLTPAQRFYLSYATLWAQNIRDEEIARLTKIDPHSLGKWRVNATLRNIDTFAQTFGIEPGDGMYLAPEERAVIW